MNTGVTSEIIHCPSCGEKKLRVLEKERTEAGTISILGKCMGCNMSSSIEFWDPRMIK